MKGFFPISWTVITALGFFCGASGWAADVEGRIVAVDEDARTFIVGEFTFQVTDDTRFEDGLRDLSGLRPGQPVEVDFEVRDGRHYATEIELD